MLSYILARVSLKYVNILFDNMDLDLLSKNLERLNRKTFMFVANPLKIKGATGAPINPVAIY